VSKVFTNATIYTGEDKIEQGYIRFDEQIKDVGKMSDFIQKPGDDVKDLDNQLIIPGFIDIHSHGGYEIDNMDGDWEKINELTELLLQEGITSYFPTTMTQSPDNIEKALKAIRKAKETNSMIQGIHLEGPFISSDYKGAQPDTYIIDPDKSLLEKWNEKSGNQITLVTYAPEVTNTKEFEQYCMDNNIVLSAGHSGATYNELMNSETTHITHLFNGQRGLHHREVGVSGYGLLNDEVYVELIVDGHHVSKEMVRLTYKTKGAEGILLITDSMRAKGLPDGESELGGQKVYVKDKEARLEDGSLAGSVLTFIDAFKNMIEMSNCSVEEAVLMSSTNQAKEFRLNNKGYVLPHYDSDLIVLSKQLNIEKTILGGNISYTV